MFFSLCFIGCFYIFEVVLGFFGIVRGSWEVVLFNQILMILFILYGLKNMFEYNLL